MRPNSTLSLQPAVTIQIAARTSPALCFDDNGAQDLLNWWCSETNPNQLWRLRSLQNGNTMVQSINKTGMCLTSKSSLAQGTRLLLATCDSTSAFQVWAMEPGAFRERPPLIALLLRCCSACGFACGFACHSLRCALRRWNVAGPPLPVRALRHTHSWRAYSAWAVTPLMHRSSNLSHTARVHRRQLLRLRGAVDQHVRYVRIRVRAQQRRVHGMLQQQLHDLQRVRLHVVLRQLAAQRQRLR